MGLGSLFKRKKKEEMARKAEEERIRLLKGRQGVEICSPEELYFRLEQERNNFDGTGT